MTQSEYLLMKSKLSFSRSLWVTVAVLAFDAALAALALWLIFAAQSAVEYWLGQMLLAFFYFHNFAVLHEAGHGNIHRRNSINIILGHYSSLFCFLPFYAWKYIHLEHHAWAGNPEKDPTMKQILKLKTRKGVPLPVKLTLRSWIPTGALLQHVVLWSYPIRAWRKRNVRRAALLKMSLSVLFLPAGYFTLHALAPSWLELWRLWPSVLFYLIIVEFVNFPHHFDMPTIDPKLPRQQLCVWEQHTATRSCHYPGILSELLILNFNLHTEHHLFPNLPWFRLKQARALVKPVLKSRYTEVHSMDWHLGVRLGDLDHIAEPSYIETPNQKLNGQLPAYP